MRISIWLPFTGFLLSFNRFKLYQLVLASGCQLPVANSQKKNTHTHTKKITIRLPFASCLFSLNCLNPLKSNWVLAASCQLPIHQNLRIGIWLAVFSCSFTAVCLFTCMHSHPLELNWHLAASCPLPIH